MRYARRSFVLLGLALAAPAPAPAQTAELPSGREVIDRFIAAIGGRDAVMRQAARHVTGRFEIPAQGIAGDLEMYAAPPNKLSATVTIEGLGAVRTGFDGTTAWAVNPAMGPMVMEGLQHDQMKQQADFYNAVYPPEMIAELETVAEEPFEGTPAYRVRVKATWGEEYFEFFDKASGLQLGSVRTQASPMGDIEATSVVSQWTDVDGLKVPFRLVQRAMGSEQVVIISAMQATPVPDSVFVPPPEIQALIGK